VTRLIEGSRARAGLLAAVLLALAVPARPASADGLSEKRRVQIARRLKEATVVVRSGPRSTGSGFVAGKEKWVVTNAHVVRGARHGRTRVRFGDGQRRAARVVAHDPRHDLAVLEVQGEPPASPLPLGDSSKVEVGETVLAFGSPFGLQGTLTQGIVSARRDLPAVGGGQIEGLIQTDAPINPGNSGGPLVDTRGKVIGVNTAILSRTGGSQGIGFAVPSTYVQQLLTRLRKEKRKASREGSTSKDSPLGAVWLGIYGDDFRGRGFAGVRVQRVVPGGPAARAGLVGASDRPPEFVHRLGIPWTGHIILAVDDHPVRSLGELRRALGRHEPGDEVELFVTVGPGVVSGEIDVELQTPPDDRPRRRKKRQ
jgi:putative serine protease PepD